MKKRFGYAGNLEEIGVSKEKTIPVLLKVGGLFLALGGLISGMLSMGVVGVKSFFHLKERVDNKFQKKYVELKIKS